MFERLAAISRGLDSLWPKRWYEGAVMIGIVIILAAMLLPPVQWASSGDTCFPVEVLVFDAETRKPINGAKVGVTRGAFAPVKSAVLDPAYRLNPASASDAVTADHGGATLRVCCSTGANYERPETHAHPQSHWVKVSADGYGKVVVPVRVESIPLEQLRKRGVLLVPVGLFRDEARE